MGALIDCHGIGATSDLQSVDPFVDQDLANYSGMKFLGVSDLIDGCAGWIIVCPTVTFLLTYTLMITLILKFMLRFQ